MEERKVITNPLVYKYIVFRISIYHIYYSFVIFRQADPVQF